MFHICLEYCVSFFFLISCLWCYFFLISFFILPFFILRPFSVSRLFLSCVCVCVCVCVLSLFCICPFFPSVFFLFLYFVSCDWFIVMVSFSKLSYLFGPTINISTSMYLFSRKRSVSVDGISIIFYFRICDQTLRPGTLLNLTKITDTC